MVRVYSTLQHYRERYFFKDTTGSVIDIFVGLSGSGKSLAVDKYKELTEFEVGWSDDETLSKKDIHAFLTLKSPHPESSLFDQFKDCVVTISRNISKTTLWNITEQFEAVVKQHLWTSNLPSIEVRFWMFEAGVE